MGRESGAAGDEKTGSATDSGTEFNAVGDVVRRAGGMEAVEIVHGDGTISRLSDDTVLAEPPLAGEPAAGVTVSRGSSWHRVAGVDEPFRIDVPNGSASSTEGIFTVVCEASGSSFVVCLEGAVLVSSPVGGIQLQAMQAVDVSPNGDLGEKIDVLDDELRTDPWIAMNLELGTAAAAVTASARAAAVPTMVERESADVAEDEPAAAAVAEATETAEAPEAEVEDAEVEDAEVEEAAVEEADADGAGTAVAAGAVDVDTDTDVDTDVATDTDVDVDTDTETGAPAADTEAAEAEAAPIVAEAEADKDDEEPEAAVAAAGALAVTTRGTDTAPAAEAEAVDEAVVEEEAAPEEEEAEEELEHDRVVVVDRGVRRQPTLWVALVLALIAAALFALGRRAENQRPTAGTVVNQSSSNTTGAPSTTAKPAGTTAAPSTSTPATTATPPTTAAPTTDAPTTTPPPAPTYDVALTRCSQSGSTIAAEGSITNTGGAVQNYRITVKFLGADQSKVAEAVATVNNVQPNQKVAWKGTGNYSGDLKGSGGCQTERVDVV